MNTKTNSLESDGSVVDDEGMSIPPYESTQELGDDIELNNCATSTTISLPDGWDIVDEEVLYADFSGVVEPSLLAAGNIIKILDIESDSPLIEVGGRAIFRGSYKDVMGTYMFFKRENDQILENDEIIETDEAELNDAPKEMPPVMLNNYSFVAKASKLIEMERVFLKSKEINEDLDRTS